jgi:hypothetical protein
MPRQVSLLMSQYMSRPSKEKGIIKERIAGLSDSIGGHREIGVDEFAFYEISIMGKGEIS